MNLASSCFMLSLILLLVDIGKSSEQANTSETTSSINTIRRKHSQRIAPIVNDATCDLVIHNSARSSDGTCRLLLSGEDCSPGSRWVFSIRRQQAECRRDPCQGWWKVRINNRCLFRYNGLCSDGMSIYEDDQGLAYCDCKPTFIFSPKENKCYSALTRAYCGAGRVLVLIRGRRRCIPAGACPEGQLLLTSPEGLRRCYPVCLHAARVCPPPPFVVVDPISLQADFSGTDHSDHVYLRYMVRRGCNAGGIYHQLGCNRVGVRRLGRKRLFERHGINDMMTENEFIQKYGD